MYVDASALPRAVVEMHIRDSVRGAEDVTDATERLRERFGTDMPLTVLDLPDGRFVVDLGGLSVVCSR
jgi:hypothetical protein